MPIYQYYDAGTHRLLERRLPVAERDAFPGRVPIPGRFFVCPREEPSPSSSVLDGFRKVEQQLGTTALERQTGFRSAEVKRIWKEAPHAQRT